MDEEKKEKISPIPIILISIALLLLTFAGGLMAGYNFFMQEKVKQEVHAWCSDTNNTSTCCMTCDQINKAKCYNQITNEWTCTPNTLCPNYIDDLQYTTTTWETPTQKSFTNTQDKNTQNALYGSN